MKVPAILSIYLALLCSSTWAQTRLSTREKQEVLNAHNHFRSRVSPTATNMERMVWNDELARVAQGYAEQCVFVHNDDRTIQQSSFSYVGENLAINSNPQVNYTRDIESWVNEVRDYDYVTNSCNPGRVCGHYTQVVWASSNNVGCGAYRCPNPVTGFPYPNGLILVCNYGPGGNFRGQRPFATGTQSCSACETEQPFCVSNLCSSTPGGSGTTLKPSVMALSALLCMVYAIVKLN